MERDIDVIVDVIPMTLPTTEPLLAGIDGIVEQYIMLSSCDVYANYDLLQRRVSGTEYTDPVGEQSALRSTQFPYRDAESRKADDADRYLDDYDKIPIEKAVQQLSCDWTVLRLPMVFGPGDKQHRFHWAIAPMLNGEAKLVIPADWGRWTSTYGYIENVGTAIALAIGHPGARQQIFNVAEEQPVSQLEWAVKFARNLAWDGVIETTDAPTHPLARRLSHLNLKVPLKIDGARIRHELGYVDVVDEATALTRTAAWDEEDLIGTTELS